MSEITKHDEGSLGGEVGSTLTTAGIGATFAMAAGALLPGISATFVVIVMLLVGLVLRIRYGR